MPDSDSKALEVTKGSSLEVKKEGRGSAPRQYVRFDKDKAIEFLAEHPQNVSFVCRALGTSRQIWDYHIKQDKMFAARVQEIRDACCDALEETMFELGKQKTSFNFNDRIAYLRAHRPHLYNPTKRIIVEGYKMSDEEKAKRLGGLSNVIDAEIVASSTTRQERQRLKQGGAQGGADGKA
jgi:hypothetical protein